MKRDLKEGRIRVLVGTHAVISDSVHFADLGLVIVDEEHRFGAKDKEKLRTLSQGVHTLTLTATPIPRTLESAAIGLRDMSLMTTPPERRRPVRTTVMEPDPVTLKQALVREGRRGGQSFVVVPRIEDIEAVAAELKALTPQLRLLVAHGKQPASSTARTGRPRPRTGLLLLVQQQPQGRRCAGCETARDTCRT